MSRGTEYLEQVNLALKKRLGELGARIDEMQKDIEGMHDYYWDNYTEMDQYGYEDFDNQQALLIAVNANQENLKTRQRLGKMLDSPFFGSVDFRFEEEDESESFYIGIGNFALTSGSLPLVYDWRAPVCSLFYDYDKGPAFYEAPGGLMKGEITSKWQYKIRGGRMIYEFESDLKIDDEILKSELGSNSDVSLKNIVRTIQKEQNAIIRNTKDKILVIQGVAGSGKTSVALHRVAYLLYHDREHLKSSNVLILSPTGVFSDYISHILPELGEENILEMSFDLFAYRELKGTINDCEDRYDQIERALKGSMSPEDHERFRWKQSKELIGAMEIFLIELEDRLVDFKNVRYKNYEMSAKEIMELFYDKFSHVPLLSRMDAVMDYYVDAFETLRGRDLAEDETEEVRQIFMKMYVTEDIYRIYQWFLQEQDMDFLPDAAPERRFIEYEDVYPMLYLKTRLLGSRKRQEIRHLVIDEMQDYSYLQYVILDSLFSCSMTILGDKAQTVDDVPTDVQTFLPSILGKNIRLLQMNKSYRNTAEIAAFAVGIAEDQNTEYIMRHGRAVEKLPHVCPEEFAEQLKTRARLGANDFETAAVITMCEAEAREVDEVLKALNIPHQYLDRNSSSFKRGLTVTTYYYAKGLEFDQVFLYGGEPSNPLFAQFRYIGATRALHELYVWEP